MNIRNITTFALALTLGLVGTALAGGGPDIQVGVDASEWSSDTMADPAGGIFPVGGGGQLNGEFTIAERDGVQIGLRATDRTDGLLTAGGKKKGLYVAPTGYDDDAMMFAEWNYDIHVDLRGSGTTLADYDLTLTHTIAPSLFGLTGPIDIQQSFEDALGFGIGHAVLLQTSQNPLFGNDVFDVEAEKTYNLKLTLKPKDGGKALCVQIQVKVRAD